MQYPRLITALITPFTGEDLDIEGLRENIHFQLEKGVEGILVLGTTGESPTLTRDERRTIIKTAVETTKGQVPVMVGTGAYSTKLTIELTQEARFLGADSALIVTPYYNCPTQGSIVEHFKAVCYGTDIPICLYHIPKRTGCHMRFETIQAIAALPRIMGIKEASADFSLSAKVAQLGLALWSGDDALTLPIMSLGGVGTISVASNLIPEKVKAMVNAASSGNFALAREHFFPILPLLNALCVETNPIPIKAAMEMCGMPSGPCRLPLSTLIPSNHQLLREALIDQGVLNQLMESEPEKRVYQHG